jgi:hypothetical protein
MRAMLVRARGEVQCDIARDRLASR